MVGILRAQNNIELASQNQRIANSFISQGRVRVRHQSEEAVKEGEELIAKGQAIKTDTFEYLENAMNDLNNDINVAVENYEGVKASAENSTEPPCVNHEYMESGFDIKV